MQKEGVNKKGQLLIPKPEAEAGEGARVVPAGKIPPKIIAPESERKLKAKRKALKISIEEGSASSVSGNLGDSYITPFALQLGAKPFAIGVLNSLSGLISPLAQIWGVKMMQHSSRKTIVTRFVLLQALMWLPSAILGILYWLGYFQSSSVYLLMGIYLVTIISGALASPAWFSWMGDIVPEEERGSYFAKRNRATGLVGLAAGLIAAFVLDAFKTRGLALVGFSLLFFFAFVFRFISYSMFKKQFSPHFVLKKKSYFSFWSFIKRMDNFGKFSLYIGFFNFALMIASPFFTVYMLKELHFSYALFMTISISSTIFYLLLQPLAGKFSDKFGNKKLLILGNIAFASYPLFWLFLHNPIWIIIIPQLISGIANACWTIGTTNFVYDSANQQHRSLCSCYSNLMGGIGTFFGSLLGGILAGITLIKGLNPYLLVFIISAVLRGTSAIIFLPRVNDDIKRKVDRLPKAHFSFHHPVKSIQHEVIFFRNIFK